MYLAFIAFVLPAEELHILPPHRPFLSDGKELQHVQQALPMLSEAGGSSNLTLLYMLHASLQPQPWGTVMVTPHSWYARDLEGIAMHFAFNH